MKKHIIKLSPFVLAFMSTTSLAAIQTTTCTTWSDDSVTCVIVLSGFNGGGSPGPSYSMSWGNNQAHVSNLSGYGRGSETSSSEVAEAIEKSYDKTPMNAETVADYKNAVDKMRSLIAHILKEYPVSDDFSEKLHKAMSQADNFALKLTDRINTGGQISAHLFNQEWGYAGSELAAFMASFAITVASGAIMATASPFIVTTVAIATAVSSTFILMPKIEEYLDREFENFNNVPDLDTFLKEVNKLFRSPSIYKVGNDNSSFCDDLPFYKQQQIEECMMRPIIIDLDNNGIDFHTIENSNVSFDIDNDGKLDTVSWPTKGNAVLFADWNWNGLDNPKEFMFSIYSLKISGTDFEGLAMFDYNEDGVINMEDKIYTKLFIWDDLNEDGISTPDEVTSIESLQGEFDLKESVIKVNNSISIKGNTVDTIFDLKIPQSESIKAYSVSMKFKRG